MFSARITGIASYVPDYILTNDELSTMVDTNDEWITTRVGIKERRIQKGEGLGSSHMGVIAVNRLLENTGCKLLTLTTVSRLQHLSLCTNAA